jgi:nucleotide-binding universal stress UspA family protein
MSLDGGKLYYRRECFLSLVKNLVKKILLALDGSKAAAHALDFALKLSEITSAELELLTVVPPVFLPSYSIYVLKSEAIADCAKELETSFRGVLSKAQREVEKKKPDLKVSTRFEKGEPDEKIVDVAEKGKFDLIVMGSRGLGGRVSALGSVSSRVVDKSSCPVLIVK